MPSPYTFEGVASDTGRVTSVTLQNWPAPISGIRFLRTDIKDRDPAMRRGYEAVCQARLGTAFGSMLTASLSRLSST